MSENHLPNAAHIGYAHFQVADLERALAFYRDLLGLRIVSQDASRAALSATGQAPILVELTARPAARRKPRRTTGLYHVAILYPTRALLADALRRVRAAGIELDGAADHGVSEAIYLRDPDGNGVELYWDKPKEQWPHDARGELAMYTRPLDFEPLLKE